MVVDASCPTNPAATEEGEGEVGLLVTFLGPHKNSHLDGPAHLGEESRDGVMTLDLKFEHGATAGEGVDLDERMVANKSLRVETGGAPSRTKTADRKVIFDAEDAGGRSTMQRPQDGGG